MKDVMKDGTGHEKERRLQCDSTWTLAVVSRRQAVKAWISLIAGGALVLGGGGFPLIGSADSRIEIAISQADRDHCASRMREYMEIVNEILWATLEEDMEGVAEAAILGVPRRYRTEVGESGGGRTVDQPRGAGRGAGEAGAGSGERARAGGGGSRHERMERVMPTAYREMMHDMHRAFQQLAVDAREQGDPRQAQRQLAQIQNSCVACHATYRFVTADDQ